MENLSTNTSEIKIGTPLSLVYNFIKNNFDIRYNEITTNLEDHKKLMNGHPKILDDRDINTIFLRLVSSLQKPPSKEFLNSFLQSHYIHSYNPFESFFEKNKDHPRSEDLITELSNTIQTDTPNVEKYIKHWLCGMIASIYGSQSPLTLVLAGNEINTGKTEWFRRLLPQELSEYYDESSLDGGKDDDILMCKKLIIMDDEFGGKNKKDHKRFKGLTSRSKKSIRVPYGSKSIDMKRLCSMCGTSNDLELLSDPYGNRRILPINVLSIDHEKYNSIDKTALIMSSYDMYKSGFHWKFVKNDINELSDASDEFHAINFEAELIDEYFEIPSNETDCQYLTTTQIKGWIELKSFQKNLSLKRLGEELRNFGFKRKSKRINKLPAKIYLVKKKGEPPINNMPDVF